MAQFKLDHKIICLSPLFFQNKIPWRILRGVGLSTTITATSTATAVITITTITAVNGAVSRHSHMSHNTTTTTAFITTTTTGFTTITTTKFSVHHKGAAEFTHTNNEIIRKTLFVFHFKKLLRDL